MTESSSIRKTKLKIGHRENVPMLIEKVELTTLATGAKLFSFKVLNQNDDGYLTSQRVVWTSGETVLFEGNILYAVLKAEDGLLVYKIQAVSFPKINNQ